MNLRVQAAADLQAIVTDGTSGFGWPVTVTNPLGVQVETTAFTNDIGQSIDPDTGVVVSGRTASVAIATSALVDAGLGLPENVPDTDRKPWVIEFEDLEGAPQTFKVTETMPDKTLGLTVCILSAYDD